MGVFADGGRPQRLFDLKTDSLEMNNLFEKEDPQEVIQRLDQMLRAYVERTKRDWGIEAIFPPPNFQIHREGRVF